MATVGDNKEGCFDVQLDSHEQIFLREVSDVWQMSKSDVLRFLIEYALAEAVETTTTR